MTAKTIATVKTRAGKEIALDTSMDFTLGELETLFDAGLMKGGNLDLNTDSNPSGLVTLFHVYANRGDVEVSEDDIRTIPMSEMARLFESIKDQTDEKDAGESKGDSPT